MQKFGLDGGGQRSLHANKMKLISGSGNIWQSDRSGKEAFKNGLPASSSDPETPLRLHVMEQGQWLSSECKERCFSPSNQAVRKESWTRRLSSYLVCHTVQDLFAA